VPAPAARRRTLQPGAHAGLRDIVAEPLEPGLDARHTTLGLVEAARMPWTLPPTVPTCSRSAAPPRQRLSLALQHGDPRDHARVGRGGRGLHGRACDVDDGQDRARREAHAGAAWPSG